MRAPPVAESSELSEWQRSADTKALAAAGRCRAPQQDAALRRAPQPKIANSGREEISLPDYITGNDLLAYRSR